MTCSSAVTGAPVSDFVGSAQQGNSFFPVRQVLHPSAAAQGKPTPPDLFNVTQKKLLHCVKAFINVNGVIIIEFLLFCQL